MAYAIEESGISTDHPPGLHRTDLSDPDTSRGAAVVMMGQVASAQRVRQVLLTAGYGPVHLTQDAAETAAIVGRIAELALCVLDVHEPTGSAQLVGLLHQHLDGPRVIVVGPTSEGQVIADALQAGADAYVASPLREHDLVSQLRGVANPEEAILRLARRTVGRMGVKEAVAALREGMMERGLRREKFSLRATAKILGMDRRSLQRAMTEGMRQHARSRPRTNSGVREARNVSVADESQHLAEFTRQERGATG